MILLISCCLPLYMLIPVAYMIRRSISCIFVFPPLITRAQGFLAVIAGTTIPCHFQWYIKNCKYSYTTKTYTTTHRSCLSLLQNFRNSKVLCSYIPTHYKHLQAVAIFTIAQQISIDPSSVCTIKSAKPDKPGDPTTRFPHPPLFVVGMPRLLLQQSCSTSPLSRLLLTAHCHGIAHTICHSGSPASMLKVARCCEREKNHPFPTTTSW